MDPLEAASDFCIRRALGFAGLGVGMTMLGLSFDAALALRSGGNLVAAVAAAMLVAAWRASRRDMRRTEAWTMLHDLAPDWLRDRPREDLQRLLRAAWRRRLLWHAERLALLALPLWTLGFAIAALRG
jgi:hypothetical protein